ncbi:hypothetical protein PG997_004009 [Apiospora hydei]|uniref:Uncharacterized protein n=1 Tax=Apiospora hydei TaxID=1337664 RepID=A0ABR1X0U8_9PEZI
MAPYKKKAMPARRFRAGSSPVLPKPAKYFSDNQELSLAQAPIPVFIYYYSSAAERLRRTQSIPSSG